MKARDVMTTEIVAIPPDMPVGRIARLLLDRCIGAVPVIDNGGVPVGMVGAGDLIGRGAAARSDWWLEILADEAVPAADVLAALRDRGRVARDVMSSPVATVDETADIADIASLLIDHRIEWVPVLRDGRVAGIVSRTDLLRLLATALRPQVPKAESSLIQRVIAELDQHFVGRERAETPRSPAAAKAAAAPETDAEAFQQLAKDFKREAVQHRTELHQAAAEQRRHEAEAQGAQHLSDERWTDLLRLARDAAERGEKAYMLLRFPSELCSDGGRAVNIAEQSWPATLRGEPAETYLRWERDLKRQGFELTARILDYPNGMPGDIGLFLVWGEGTD
jgi:CBS domain-containing protein